MIKLPPKDELIFENPEDFNSLSKPLIIECEAEGEPEPVHKWLHNGIDIEPEFQNQSIPALGKGSFVRYSPSSKDEGS